MYDPKSMKARAVLRDRLVAIENGERDFRF